MAKNLSSSQIDRLKRQAKRIVRESSLTHAEALDRLAVEHGFPNWSQLSTKGNASGDAGKVTQVVKASEGPRYYLHGDQDETDPSSYFCAGCDYFYPPDHFEDATVHRGQSHEMRYLVAVERWRARGSTGIAHSRRPSNPVNLLAEKAASMKAAYQAARSPFHRWLLARADRNDIVSDLAADVRADKDFPFSVESRSEIEVYLARHGSYVLEALEQAWEEFSVAHRDR